MAEPFLAEVRIFSFVFPPKGWALCNGQLLPINQNQGLFALLGTTYGGDGRVNFALPDLRARTPIHVGNGHTLGERAGSDSVTLNISEMPRHSHVATATSGGQADIAPTNNFFSGTTPSEFYSGAPNSVMAPQMISGTGGSQPHNNMQPSLVLSMCIALQGIFPSQN